MIEQYLSNTNESATIIKILTSHDLNNAVESFYIRSEDTKSSTCSGTSHMLCFLQIDHAVHAESQTSLGISVSTPRFTRFGNIHHACWESSIVRLHISIVTRAS
jgi:hypothetical protein